MYFDLSSFLNKYNRRQLNFLEFKINREDNSLCFLSIDSLIENNGVGTNETKRTISIKKAPESGAFYHKLKFSYSP
jgi:hypothetical protein